MARGVIWGGAGGGGGGQLPPQASGPPPPTKPQLAPHITQAPRSNSSWFSIIPAKIQMCHHFNITFSFILHVFFCFCFLWRRQGRSQGRLASNKKLIFKGSPALLELIFVPNFCWNTLLMWLQKAHEIAQNQKIFSRGSYCPPPPPTRTPPCWLGSLHSPSCLCPPPPKKNLKWRPCAWPVTMWDTNEGGRSVPSIPQLFKSTHSYNIANCIHENHQQMKTNKTFPRSSDDAATISEVFWYNGCSNVMMHHAWWWWFLHSLELYN